MYVYQNGSAAAVTAKYFSHCLVTRLLVRSLLNFAWSGHETSAAKLSYREEFMYWLCVWPRSQALAWAESLGPCV